ncbi:hypothetical protein IAT38_002879 [Cryptococcus sp. DSM 104549]
MPARPPIRAWAAQQRAQKLTELLPSPTLRDLPLEIISHIVSVTTHTHTLLAFCLVNRFLSRDAKAQLYGTVVHLHTTRAAISYIANHLMRSAITCKRNPRHLFPPAILSTFNPVWPVSRVRSIERPPLYHQDYSTPERPNQIWPNNFGYSGLQHASTDWRQLHLIRSSGGKFDTPLSSHSRYSDIQSFVMGDSASLTQQPACRCHARDEWGRLPLVPRAVHTLSWMTLADEWREVIVQEPWRADFDAEGYRERKREEEARRAAGGSKESPFFTDKRRSATKQCCVKHESEGGRGLCMCMRLSLTPAQRRLLHLGRSSSHLLNTTFHGMADSTGASVAA